MHDTRFIGVAARAVCLRRNLDKVGLRAADFIIPHARDKGNFVICERSEQEEKGWNRGKLLVIWG